MVLLSRACCGSVGPGELRGCETIATGRKCGNILASSLTSITKRCGMTVSLLALDYSRPIQPLFTQASRAGSIHSAFHDAVSAEQRVATHAKQREAAASCGGGFTTRPASGHASLDWQRKPAHSGP